MTTFSSRSVKGAGLALALMLAIPTGTLPADARAGGGMSFGSRGARTYSAPPATMTAPRPAQPIWRSETPNFNSGAAAAAATQPRRFGFGSGLAAGLLGAGLFGMLTGHGFFGGLGGLASLLGLMFQLALIYGLIRLALNFFRNRGAAPVMARSAGPAYDMGPSPTGAGLGGIGSSRSGDAVAIGPQDFGAFERALMDIQAAYGREDMGALSRLVTPEMLRVFGQDIEGNRRQGVRNDVRDAKLLQGDLSESWREGATDYATVAMRFAAHDTMVDRTTGRIVEGDPNRLNEATEVWTFRRDRGGPWLLSAIQQAN